MVPGPHWLEGCDPTSRIVSVDADTRGNARIWRRLRDGNVELSRHRFPNWFLTTSLELLQHLSFQRLPATALRAAHGIPITDAQLTVIELDGDVQEDSYRYLVLTTSDLKELETDLVDTANKRDGEEARSLSDLRGLVLIWDPTEQFLILSGRTYFKDTVYEDLRRLQFDLETTGLDDERDRIFMVSMRDSTGWRDCLEASTLGEAGLIARFTQIIQTRDPDILENHNIFAFDLSFLVRRAARLGIPLALGRDQTPPTLETDIFDTGERAEPFLRWRIAGREVIDTQHAVRQFGLAAPDLRRHGLKDAARYFGFARDDREYVPGAEIWPTYQVDPDRIRRYAADDVDEVDGLSRRLLPSAFHMARRLPRPYQRIAADVGPASLWDPLLVRVYLHEGRALPAPTPRLMPLGDGAPELRLQGVVSPAARAAAEPLLPRVLASQGIRAANDTLSAQPRLLQSLLATDDVAPLVLASHAYLAGEWLFSDPHAALAASIQARHVIDLIVEQLSGRGCRVIEIDGDHVLFQTPSDWDSRVEDALSIGAGAYMPSGVHLSFTGHFDAIYARAPGSTILLNTDGSVTLRGSTFRPGRLERYGEAFIRHAARCALQGDAAGVRRVFLETVHLLRSAQLPLEDMCVPVTLHRSPAEYRRAALREEPYEVLLAAGVRSWRVGQRIRYFRARGGEARLLVEGDTLAATDADIEYYVQRLVSVYCQQFAQAFRRADFLRIFELPDGVGPWPDPGLDAELETLKPIAEPV